MKPEEVGQDRLVVGQLAGVYGVKGWLKVRSFTQPEENILRYKPWYLRTAHGLKMLEVDESHARPQGLVVHFKNLDDRDLAAQIGRAKIEVAKEQLPELDEGDFYWHQLEGLQVFSEWESNEYLLGTVARVMETGANDVLVVAPSEGSIDQRERLVPYVLDQYVTEVDLRSRRVRVVWDPEF